MKTISLTIPLISLTIMVSSIFFLFSGGHAPHNPPREFGPCMQANSIVASLKVGHIFEINQQNLLKLGMWIQTAKNQSSFMSYWYDSNRRVSKPFKY